MKPVRKAKEMAIIAIKQSAKPAKKRKIESKSTQTTAKTDDFRLKDCSVSVERLPAELQQGSVRIAINDKNDDAAKSTENAVAIVYIEKNVNAVTEDTERLPMRIESNSVVRDVSKKIAKTSNRQKANSRAAPIAAKKGVRRILSQGDIERNESSGPGHSNMTHPTKRVRAPSVHVVESNKNDDDAAVSSVHDNLVRVKGGGNYADVVKIIKEKVGSTARCNQKSLFEYFVLFAESTSKCRSRLQYFDRFHRSSTTQSYSNERRGECSLIFRVFRSMNSFRPFFNGVV